MTIRRHDIALPASLKVTDAKLSVLSARVVLPAQDLLERVPELRTEYGVDDWIKRGIEIP